jgi:prepilin-type N-terminal cleavage/methylation domain-containing protein
MQCDNIQARGPQCPWQESPVADIDIGPVNPVSSRRHAWDQGVRRCRRTRGTGPHRCARRAADSQSGFTLTELMVTVVIISVLSAVATPLLMGDSREAHGRNFAKSITQDFARARNQAVAERLPTHAYIYRDRIEFRLATAGASLGAPPVAPTLGDPVVRVTNAREGIVVADVTADQTPPADEALTTAVPVEIIFDTLGGARRADGVVPFAPVYVWIRNNSLGRGHPKSLFRIEVIGLTGAVELQEAW